MDKQCNWITLLPEVILGAEENAKDDSKDESKDSKKDDSKDAKGDSKTDPEDDDDDEDDDEKIPDDKDVSGLKSALTKERDARKLAEKKAKADGKELARLQKLEEERETAALSDADKATKKAEKAEERANKLAEGYKRNALTAAITAAAKKAGFIDTDDALLGVDREAIEVEQDDEDPSIVKVDEKEIKRLVKELATKKPHFISSGTDDGEATGSSFAGKGKPKQKSSEDTYKERYPSLN